MTSKFMQRQSHESVAGIPRWSKTCCVTGCDAETVVAFAVGQRDGRRVVTYGSDLVETDERKQWRLKGGCSVDGWITRCAEHWALDLLKHRRSAWTWDPESLR